MCGSLASGFGGARAAWRYGGIGVLVVAASVVAPVVVCAFCRVGVPLGWLSRCVLVVVICECCRADCGYFAEASENFGEGGGVSEYGFCRVESVGEGQFAEVMGYYVGCGAVGGIGCDEVGEFGYEFECKRSEL